MGAGSLTASGYARDDEGSKRYFVDGLADEVGEEGHEAGLLDGVGKFALVPDADAGALAGHDLAEG